MRSKGQYVQKLLSPNRDRHTQTHRQTCVKPLLSAFASGHHLIWLTLSAQKCTYKEMCSSKSCTSWTYDNMKIFVWVICQSYVTSSRNCQSFVTETSVFYYSVSNNTTPWESIGMKGPRNRLFSGSRFYLISNSFIILPC